MPQNIICIIIYLNIQFLLFSYLLTKVICWRDYVFMPDLFTVYTYVTIFKKKNTHITVA